MPLNIDDGKLNPPIKVGIWESRHKSQLKAIKELQTFLSNNEIDRKPLLQNFVQALYNFGNKHFGYFYEGFGYYKNSEDEGSEGKESKAGFLEYSPEQPPEFVLRSILNQLAYDTSATERAIKQRADPLLASALKQADVIAYNAMVPALGANNLLKQNARVITYFQRIPEVLVVPYADVALIGIPYSAIGENGVNTATSMRDYLSIPHEVGHYVYWRGTTTEGRLHVELRRRVIAYGLGAYLNWLEEIFADVYGCLVGGEVMGLSAQDLHFDDLPSRLNEDNQEHPAPVIRPVIYMHTLNRLRGRNSDDDDEEKDNQESDNFVTMLNRRWRRKLLHRGNPKHFKLRFKSFDNPEFRDIRLGRNDLREIVDIILDVLLSEEHGFKSDWGVPYASTESLDDQAETGIFSSPRVTSTAAKEASKLRGSNASEGVKEPDDDKLEVIYENFVANLAENSKHMLSRSKYKTLIGDEDPIFSAPTKNDSWATYLLDITKPCLPASIWNVAFIADGWGPGSGDGDANTKALEDDGR